MHSPHLERVPAGNGTVKLKGICMVTGREHTTPPVSEEALKRYEAGELAPFAFPELSLKEREFLISGMSPEAWEMVQQPLPPSKEELEGWAGLR